MKLHAIEADYLVIGGGAAAMAFVDTLIGEQPDANVVMVDRHHRPGGHWNDAYPFVRLHQPSNWYGVASRELGQGTKDTGGFNIGLYGLASGAEILTYFDHVMQQHFLPTGRVRWFPMSEYRPGAAGEHLVVPLMGGESRQVVVRKKVVDATHAQTEVPSTHPPRYAVAEGVKCIPLNGLPQVSRPYANYTVVGSGKTGLDAAVWMLENGVPPERMRWIRPRDAWFMNRANLQPGLENFERSMGSTVAEFDAITEATSVADLFARLEHSEQLLRIDPNVEPTTYRCATVSQGELAQLRRITDVIRMGRVRSIENTRLVLDQGSVAADPDTLYIDCSASGIVKPRPGPAFDGDRINLLLMRTCQPMVSAAVLAWIESHVADEAQKQALCAVVPSPEVPLDWLRMWVATIENTARWRQNPALTTWLSKCRLNAVAVYMRGVTSEDTEKLALARSVGIKSGAALASVKALLASAE